MQTVEDKSGETVVAANLILKKVVHHQVLDASPALDVDPEADFRVELSETLVSRTPGIIRC
jgi:hypothetical protein